MHMPKIGKQLCDTATERRRVEQFGSVIAYIFGMFQGVPHTNIISGDLFASLNVHKHSQKS